MITELRVRTEYGPEGCIEAEVGFIDGEEKFAHILYFDSVYYGITAESMMDKDDMETLEEYTREEALASKYGDKFKLLETVIDMIK